MYKKLLAQLLITAILLNSFGTGTFCAPQQPTPAPEKSSPALFLAPHIAINTSLPHSFLRADTPVRNPSGAGIVSYQDANTAALRLFSDYQGLLGLLDDEIWQQAGAIMKVVDEHPEINFSDILASRIPHTIRSIMVKLLTLTEFIKRGYRIAEPLDNDPLSLFDAVLYPPSQNAPQLPEYALLTHTIFSAPGTHASRLLQIAQNIGITASLFGTPFNLVAHALERIQIQLNNLETIMETATIQPIAQAVLQARQLFDEAQMGWIRQVRHSAADFSRLLDTCSSFQKQLGFFNFAALTTLTRTWVDQLTKPHAGAPERIHLFENTLETVFALINSLEDSTTHFIHQSLINSSHLLRIAHTANQPGWLQEFSRELADLMQKNRENPLASHILVVIDADRRQFPAPLLANAVAAATVEADAARQQDDPLAAYLTALGRVRAGTDPFMEIIKTITPSLLPPEVRPMVSIQTLQHFLPSNLQPIVDQGNPQAAVAHLAGIMSHNRELSRIVSRDAKKLMRQLFHELNVVVRLTRPSVVSLPQSRQVWAGGTVYDRNGYYVTTIDGIIQSDDRLTVIESDCLESPDDGTRLIQRMEQIITTHADIYTRQSISDWLRQRTQKKSPAIAALRFALDLGTNPDAAARISRRVEQWNQSKEFPFFIEWERIARRKALRAILQKDINAVVFDMDKTLVFSPAYEQEKGRIENIFLGMAFQVPVLQNYIEENNLPTAAPELTEQQVGDLTSYLERNALFPQLKNQIDAAYAETERQLMHAYPYALKMKPLFHHVLIHANIDWKAFHSFIERHLDPTPFISYDEELAARFSELRKLEIPIIIASNNVEGIIRKALCRLLNVETLDPFIDAVIHAGSERERNIWLQKPEPEAFTAVEKFLTNRLRLSPTSKITIAMIGDDLSADGGAVRKPSGAPVQGEQETSIDYPNITWQFWQVRAHRFERDPRKNLLDLIDSIIAVLNKRRYPFGEPGKSGIPAPVRPQAGPLRPAADIAASL